MNRSVFIFLICILPGCTRAAGVPIFIPAPNPIPIEVATDSKVISHPIVHPLVADSTAPSFPAEGDSADAEKAAAAESDRISADEILTIDVHNGEVNAIAVAPDGTKALSGGNDGLVIQTSLVPAPGLGAGSVGAIETQTLLQGSKPIQALALDSKGKVLAISQYGSVVVYDIETREIVARLTRLDGRVTAISWDARGELLALGRADGGLFVWNVFKGPHAGEDSLDAVERYNGGSSPIDRIIFHPSARIFFALEKKGTVGIWRLARTEYEMGLRDTDINRNEPQLGIRRWTFLQLPSVIEDFGIGADGKNLHLVMADGKVIQWKIRGLKAVGVVGAAEANSYQLNEITVRNGQSGLNFIGTTGRTETLSIWCQASAGAPGDSRLVPAADTDEPTSLAAESDEEDDSGEVGSSAADPTQVSLVNEFTDVSGGVQVTEPFVPDIAAIKSVWRFTPLRQPLKAIESPLGAGTLWATQKTGNLLVFKLNSLVSPIGIKRYQQQCKD